MTTPVVGYYQFEMEHVALVEMNFWLANPGLMDDSGSERPFVPDGFYELSEGIYEHTFDTLGEAKRALEVAGWVEKDMFKI